MKFLTISLLAIATLFNISADAQCPMGNIVLETQAEVDAFPATFPGCTMITGKIKINDAGTPPNTITNLDSLKYITSVAVSLDIQNCPLLTDITGLINITSSGEVDIERCNALTSLDGLQGLTTLGDLEISNCNALTDISDLSGLTSLSGQLNLKANDGLTSLNGLHNITSIGDSLVLDDNDALLNLDGLSGLTSIGGDLRIDDNNALTSISGLSSLTSIGDDVRMFGNKSLTTLDGLGSVTTIGGGVDIKNNDVLSNCLGACEMINAVMPPESYNFDGNASVQCNDESVLEADCLIFLPVELTGFRAKEDKKNKTVVLSWATASELNNKHFEVERAADGRNFEAIGIVGGNGTTTKANNYSFVDSRPIATAYYRLKQVDYDGGFSYSDLVLVKMAKAESAQVAAYPTIAKNEITVRFTGFEAQNGTFSVFNSQGKLVLTEQVDLSNKMAYKSLNIAKFDTGIYIIVISDNANHISTNFVVVK
jgi:hypothetical protein